MAQIKPWVPADERRLRLLQVIATWIAARFFAEGYGVSPSELELRALHLAVCDECQYVTDATTASSTGADYIERLDTLAHRGKPLDGMPIALWGGETLQEAARALFGAYLGPDRKFPNLGLLRGVADPPVALRDAAVFGWLVLSFAPAEGRGELSMRFCEMLHLSWTLTQHSGAETTTSWARHLEAQLQFFQLTAPMLCNVGHPEQRHVFREVGLPSVIAFVGESCRSTLAQLQFA